jgi:hypothetical protein
VKGALNLFQAQMLRWRDLHPYNAVHAVALAGAVDAAAIDARNAGEVYEARRPGL